MSLSKYACYNLSLANNGSTPLLKATQQSLGSVNSSAATSLDSLSSPRYHCSVISDDGNSSQHSIQTVIDDDVCLRPAIVEGSQQHNNQETDDLIKTGFKKMLRQDIPLLDKISTGVDYFRILLDQVNIPSIITAVRLFSEPNRTPAFKYAIIQMFVSAVPALKRLTGVLLEVGIRGLLFIFEMIQTGGISIMGKLLGSTKPTDRIDNVFTPEAEGSITEDSIFDTAKQFFVDRGQDIRYIYNETAHKAGVHVDHAKEKLNTSQIQAIITRIGSIAVVIAALLGVTIPAGTTDIGKTITKKLASASSLLKSLTTFKTFFADVQPMVSGILVDVFGMEPEDQEYVHEKEVFNRLNDYLARTQTLFTRMSSDVSFYPRNYMEMRKFVNEVHSLLSDTRSKEKYHKRLANLRTTVASLERAISRMSEAMTRFHNIMDTKIEPTVIWLYGKSGVGKSYLGTKIVTALSKIHKKKLSVYARGNTNYWDDYAGQDVCLWDDMGAIVDNDDMSQFANIVTPATTVLNMASLDAKGTVFMSKYIIVCSNMIDGSHCKGQLADVTIIERRRDILLHVDDPLYDPNGPNVHRKKDCSHLRLTRIKPVPVNNTYRNDRVSSFDAMMTELHDKYIKRAEAFRVHTEEMQNMRNADVIEIPNAMPPFEPQAMEKKSHQLGLVVFLIGAPGTGKTHFVERVADPLGTPMAKSVYIDEALATNKVEQLYPTINSQVNEKTHEVLYIVTNFQQWKRLTREMRNVLKRRGLVVKIKSNKKHSWLPRSRFNKVRINNSVIHPSIIGESCTMEAKYFGRPEPIYTFSELEEYVKSKKAAKVTRWEQSGSCKLSLDIPYHSIRIGIKFMDLLQKNMNSAEVYAKVMRSMNILRDGKHLRQYAPVIKGMCERKFSTTNVEACIGDLNAARMRAKVAPTILQFEDEGVAIQNYDGDHLLFLIRSERTLYKCQGKYYFREGVHNIEVVNDAEIAQFTGCPFFNREQDELLEQPKIPASDTYVNDRIKVLIRAFTEFGFMIAGVVAATAKWDCDKADSLDEETKKRRTMNNKNSNVGSDPATNVVVDRPRVYIEPGGIIPQVPDCTWANDDDELPEYEMTSTANSYDSSTKKMRPEQAHTAIEQRIAPSVLVTEDTGAGASGGPSGERPSRSVIKLQPARDHHYELTNNDFVCTWEKLVNSEVMQYDRQNLATESKDKFYTEAMDDEASKTIIEKIRKNVIKVDGCCFGIMVKKKVGITVAHIFPGSAESFTITHEDKQYSAVLKKKHPDIDMAIFEVISNDCPCFADITGHMFPETVPDLRYFKAWHVIPHERRDFVVPVVLDSMTNYSVQDSDEHRSGIQYLPNVVIGSYRCMFTTKGDCGSFFVINNTTQQKKFVGIHCAASASKGIISVCTKQLFEEFESEGSSIHPLDTQCVVLETPLADAWSENVKNLGYVVNPNTELGERYEQEPMRVRTNFKTNLVRSPLYYNIDNQEFDVAALHPKDNRIKSGDLNRNAYYKWDADPVSPDMDLLVEATKAVAIDLASRIRDSNTPLKKLTTTEALNRWTLLSTSNPIQRNSSAGFPHSKLKGATQKHHILECSSVGDVTFRNSEAARIVQQNIELIEQQAKCGRRTAVVFEVGLKDEVRKIEKIATGMTRSIAMSPVDFVIVHRKWFHAAGAAIAATRDEHPIKVGFNPYSIDAHHLRQYMRSVGSQGWDIDFKSFDATVPRQLLECVPEVYNILYRYCDPNYDEKHDLTRRTLYEHIIAPWYLIESRVYQASSGMPSGQPATAVDNSIINWIIHCYCWLKIMREKQPQLANYANFKRCVRLAVYGDDCMLVVNPESIGFFNFVDISKIIAEDFGMKTTSGDKSNNTAPKSVEDMTFLQRYFCYDHDHQIWRMPLNYSSLKKMSSFVKAERRWSYGYGAQPDYDRYTLEATGWALIREAALHSEKFYETTVTHVNRVLLECGVNSVPYSARRTILESCVQF
nr:TPA_asm: hypothetical protein [Vittapili virus]